MKVIKVVRQITYFGDSREVGRILRKSLPCRKFYNFTKGVTISIKEVKREEIPADKVPKHIKDILEEYEDGETSPIQDQHHLQRPGSND